MFTLTQIGIQWHARHNQLLKTFMLEYNKNKP